MHDSSKSSPDNAEFLEPAEPQRRESPVPPDPFDPASLRVSANYAEGLGVKKVLTTIPVRKPNKTEWFRVRPGEEYRIDTTVFETEGVDRATYLVVEGLREEVGSSLSVVQLLWCTNLAGDQFIWRIKLPNADGRTNPWSESAIHASAAAEKRWCRLVPNMGAGCYDLYQTDSQWSEPTWSDLSLREVLELAFRGRVIDTADHVLLKELRGEA